MRKKKTSVASRTHFNMYFHHTCCIYIICYILLRITSGVWSDVKVTRPLVGWPKKNGFIPYKEKYFSLLHNLPTGYGVCLAPYSISNQALSLGVKRGVVIPFTRLHLLWNPSTLIPSRTGRECNTPSFSSDGIFLYQTKADATYCFRLNRTAVTLSVEAQRKVRSLHTLDQ